ncbi:hypothetical protein AbraIFM66950_006840 [Aspergillus brasiliensis]|nr:hypothetical protein AbraIFM66950_006840 [Aspergillus brasiliensis]
MAVPAVDFPLFPRLPAELRVQIWEETLPKFVCPLYFYRKGCWTVENGDREKVDIKFNRLSLNTEIDVPIFSVNREAFRVTRSWMKIHVSRDTLEIGPSFLEFLFQHPFHRATQKLVIVDNAEFLPNNSQELQHHWKLNSALSTPAFVWNCARDRFEEGGELATATRISWKG